MTGIIAIGSVVGTSLAEGLIDAPSIEELEKRKRLRLRCKNYEEVLRKIADGVYDETWCCLQARSVLGRKWKGKNK